MGVRRAVETTLDTIRTDDVGVSTFGPLIHNPQVLDLLEDRGVKILKDIPDQEAGTVIIRAHGVPPSHKMKLLASGAKVQDATCPHVVKVQVIIKKYKKQGYSTIIIGDRNHAEVEGLMGYAGELGIVVSNEDDVARIQPSTPYIIVSQTTQDENAFEQLSDMILEWYPGGKVFNTICDATHKRQDEVRNLCEKVQAMVVVGGKNSANTQRLGEIAESMGCPVYKVETEEDLNAEILSKYDRVGVTAGASTPTWMINRVIRFLESIPGQGEGVLSPFLYKVLRFLLVTNIYVALGGGVLAYASGLLQEIQPQTSHFFIAFCYLFAMHNLNRFTDQRSKKYSDFIQVEFYKRYRWSLFTVSAISLPVAITLAYGLGKRPFFLLSGMSFFGIIYSVRFIPRYLLPITRIRMLKEIPGSKTFFVAIAWAFVTVLIPAWEIDYQPGLKTLNVLIIVMMLVYVRNALFDVFEVQGDRIVGKETLPVCIGEEKTLKILYAIMGVLIISLLVMPLIGAMAPFGFWLLPGVFYLGFITYAYQTGSISQGPKLEFYLESIFIIIAGLTWLGSL